MPDDDVRRKLLDIPGVTGVSGGKLPVKSSPLENKLVVFVDNPEAAKMVPEVLEDGTKTHVIVSGKIKFHASQVAVSQDINRKAYMRPARPGVSIGNKDVTVGTFGAVVYDVNGQKFILSANHVLANNNASNGLAIYQPGPFDGGNANDTIADLYDSVRIRSDADNIVDAALAAPLDNSNIDSSIIEIGTPNNTIKQPISGMTLIKSGRTSGVTSGVIIDANATIKVTETFGDYIFDNQIITTKMSEPGDSGSLSLDENLNPVGLVFAGNDTMTFHNKIENVLNAFGVTFQGPVTPIPPPPTIKISAMPLFLFGGAVIASALYGRRGG